MKPESTWTPARPDCPHPEWWHAEDDESAEVEVTELVCAFVRALQPEFVLETGTAFGQTAYAIGRALVQNGHGRCVSIDTDAARLEGGRERCAGFPVEFVQADALTYVPPEPVDFAWIDTGQNRAQELLALREHLAPGAVVGIHDTGPQHTVWASLEIHGVLTSFNYLRLHTPRGVVFLTTK